MNATVEKFLFDLDFSDPSTVEEQLKSRAETRARETERTRMDGEVIDGGELNGEEHPSDKNPEQPNDPEEAPAPTFSKKELEAAERDGFEAGRREGIREAAETAENLTLKTLTALQQGLEAAYKRNAEALRRAHKDSVAVACALVEKAFPVFSQKSGSEEVAALVARLMDRMHNEPRLVVHVAPDIAETITRQLDELARDTGFDGKVIVKAMDGLSPSDCQVQWTDGGAERRVGDIWSDIESIIAEYMDEGSYPPQSGDDGGDGRIAEEMTEPADDAAGATNETMELSEQATKNADTRSPEGGDETGERSHKPTEQDTEPAKNADTRSPEGGGEPTS